MLLLWGCGGGPTLADEIRVACPVFGIRPFACVDVAYPEIQSTLFVAMDDDGLHTFSVGFEPMPILVWGGSEDYVLRRQFIVKLPFEVEIVSLQTFIGLEAGDKVEADIEIFTDSNVLVYSRSYHGHVAQSYEAYDTPPIVFPLNAQPNASELIVGIVGRCVGTHYNPGDARHGELNALMHWGFRFNAITRR